MTQVLRRSTVQTVLLSAVLLVFAPNYVPAQEPTEVSPVRTQEESARKVLSKVSPSYPIVAYKMEIQGSVKVEAVVSPSGSVKAVAVKGGHPMLAQAAQDAVRGWKWEPSPRETRELVEIKFTRQ
ncbi:MAG TPA: energy transducer TonB [Candidatus Sulfotelmatobacter sp.]